MTDITDSNDINYQQIEIHDFKYTQYIIINSDVKMGKGKAITQGCHASLGAFLSCKNVKHGVKWITEGGRKIILKANEEEILKLYQVLRINTDIPTYMVHDFGCTQIKPGTLTAFGIGPYDIGCLKEYVKDLKLV